MSLKNLGSKAIDGAKKTAGGTMFTGWTGKLVAVLFGVLVGVAADFLLQYIFSNFVFPMTDEKNADGTYKNPKGMHTLYLDGFSIYPFQNVNGHYYMYYDDLILLISTALLLITRKFWFVIGYFLGWYFSGWFGLYRKLKLPIGVRDVDYPT